MSLSPFFSDQELADAAYDFLTSSTSNRFALKAKEAAQRARLRQQVAMVPQMTRSLVERAQTLWRNLRRSPRRDMPGVELAILLVLLSETATQGVDELLVDVSLVDQASVAWIGSLARHLLQERASNTDQHLAEAPLKGVRVDVKNLSNIHQISDSPALRSIISARDCSSQPDRIFAFT
jgi:hypothetical protein